jgi:hypothetical protein
VSRRRTGKRRGKWGENDGDEFGGLWLDEAFVRDAVVVELSAERRAAKQRRDRLQSELEEGKRRAARAGRVERRRRRRLPALLVVALLALVAARLLSGSPLPASTWSDAGTAGRPDRLLYDGKLADQPPPGREESGSPLGRPPSPAMLSDRFLFLAVRPGTNTPVAYDPCRPLHLVVNTRTAPPGADVLFTDALDAVRRATGLTIVIDGPTDEAPVARRLPYQPDRYPARWAPVLVAWSDPEESPALSDRVAGTGGSLSVSAGDDRVYVTGVVTLDGPQVGRMLQERDGHARARGVIQHELGHLVGLDHIADPTQLMNPIAVQGRTSFGDGDLTGLAFLGGGRCFPAV